MEFWFRLASDVVLAVVAFVLGTRKRINDNRNDTLKNIVSELELYKSIVQSLRREIEQLISDNEELHTENRKLRERISEIESKIL